MARIYPVSHSSDGRFSGRTNRRDGVRYSDDSRWSEFLPDALLRILRWQTGRRKNRPILAQTGYDKKRDQPSSSLHCGIARLRRYTPLDCPLYHSSLDVLHSKQAGVLCAGGLGIVSLSTTLKRRQRRKVYQIGVLGEHESRDSHPDEWRERVNAAGEQPSCPAIQLERDGDRDPSKSWVTAG